jgi:hypothetical protein
LIYIQPGAEMLRAGVTPNTVFFEGKYDGQLLSGKAVTFRKECRGLNFDVSGEFSLEKRSFVLSGKKPTRNRSCRIVSYSDVRLEFERLNGNMTVRQP